MKLGITSSYDNVSGSSKRVSESLEFYEVQSSDRVLISVSLFVQTLDIVFVCTTNNEEAIMQQGNIFTVQDESRNWDSLWTSFVVADWKNDRENVE